MNTPRYVAAIEVSSSKVIGAVGRIYPDGKLEVIATEQEKCVECVRFGQVHNVEETALRIARIINLLERHKNIAPHKITGIFIGLSGRSLRAIDASVSLALPEETIINREIVEKLRRKAEEKAIDSSLEVIDAVPRNFTVDTAKTNEPLGTLGQNIKAVYDLIVCRPQLKRNLMRTGITDRLGITNNGFIVTPLATGQIIPTEQEKRQGCMLVDMGAETTAVTIYKEGSLQYFVTLPLGSRNITRDITSLNLLEESAEDIKIQSGNAIPTRTSTKLNIHGVDMAEISNIIVARAEEIMLNILEQINYAGMKDNDLAGGIILIGGGVHLKNMKELIERTSKLKVREGQLPSSYITAQGKTPSFEAIQVISILYAGATRSDAECLTSASQKELPENGDAYQKDDDNVSHKDVNHKEREQRQPSRFKKFFTRIGEILTPEDEDDEDDKSELEDQ